MTKPQVYITRSDIPKEATDILRKSCDVTYWDKEEPISREQLLKNVKGKDGLFCMFNDQIDEELLNSAGPNLKVIATMSAGFDHINVEEAHKRGIRIGHTPDKTDATAELTVALLIATSRRLIEANREIHNGGWKYWAPFWMCGPSLTNSTVGIVGFGQIGQAIARRLKPFQVCQFLYYSRTDKKEAENELGARRVSFDQLLAESDFVIAACSLTPETNELFDKAAFCKMKPTAVFVNISRGAVVKQDDLIEALENKTILAAGLDVMTPEPLPLDSPLMKFKNCVLLPHIGSAVNCARNEMAELTANNIVAGINGYPMPAELVL